MNINIKYGIDFEIARVKNTLAKLDWYITQGYKPRLPESIKKDSSEQEIQNQIKKEYAKEKYKEIGKKIIHDFSLIQKTFTERVKDIFSKETPDAFLINLTNYGVDGSYNLPNTVIFNINNRKGLKTVIHEIIHIFIESYIKKYEIQHWEKERIVDLILNSKEFTFLDYNNWQSGYNNVEKYIDNLFMNDFLKDKNKFFSKVKDIRLQYNQNKGNLV